MNGDTLTYPETASKTRAETTADTSSDTSDTNRSDDRDPAPARTLGWTVFETALGWCGIAWGDAGITGTSLPGTGADSTRTYLQGRFTGIAESDPTPMAAGVIDRIRALLDGGTDDLADVPLDLAGVGEFGQAAYRIARAVLPGRTTTYGAIAAQLGGPGVARAVGRAMGDNPFPIIVPCHRVTGADGSIGGFSAPGGARTKHRMLMMEAPGEQERPGLFGADELFG